MPIPVGASVPPPLQSLPWALGPSSGLLLQDSGSAATAVDAGSPAGTVDIGGTPAASAPAGATGSVSIGGTATASAAASAAGSVSIGGAPTAQATATASGAVSIGGAPAAAAATQAAGGVSIGGTPGAAASGAASGSVVIGGTGTPAAAASTSGGVVVGGAPTAGATGSAAGQVVIGGAVAGTGASSGAGTVQISGTAAGTSGIPRTASGSITIGGSASGLKLGVLEVNVGTALSPDWRKIGCGGIVGTVGRLELWDGTQKVREACDSDTGTRRPLYVWTGGAWDHAACMVPVTPPAPIIPASATYQGAAGGTLPAGILAGDLLLLWVNDRGNALTPPSGWTQLRADIDTSGVGPEDQHSYLYAKTAVGTESGTVVAAGGASATFKDATFMAFRGATTVTHAFAAGTGSPFRTSMVAPSVTAPGVGLLICRYAWNSGGLGGSAALIANAPTPTGMTVVGSADDGDYAIEETFQESITGAGATGTRTVTFTGGTFAWAATATSVLVSA